MTSEHPDDLDLELARTGEAAGDVLQHLETCETCQERVAALRDLARRAARPLDSLDVPAAVDHAMLRMARDQAAAVRRRLQPARRPSTVRRILPWAAAAGLAAAALGTWLLLRGGSTAGPSAARLTSRQAGPGPAGRLSAVGGTQVAGGVEDDGQGHAASPSTSHQPPLDRLGASPATSSRSVDDVNADGKVDVLDAYLVALAADRGDGTAALDRNGDGYVDRRDAERLVMAAVTLRRGPDEGTTDEHR